MALVNPNIAMGYRAPELPQQNALADYAAVQQIQSNRRQGEVADMQLEQMRRDQAALSRMQAAITAKGGPSDLNVAAEEMINSGIPEYFKQGLIIKQTLDKQSRFAKLFGPTGGAAPANAMYSPSEAYPGYNESIGMTNALAPAPAAAPDNAMADMRRKIDAAYQIGTPEALAFAKAGEDRLKSVTLSASSSVFDPETQSFKQAPAAPPAPTETNRLQAERAALIRAGVPPTDPRIQEYDQKLGPAPTDIAKLTRERDALPPGSPNRALYDRAIKDLGATAENARQRLAFDQNKFGWEKANPGFEIREAEDGSVVGVNKRTLQAFPVTLGGGAPAAAPAAGGASVPAAQPTPAPAPSGTPLRGKSPGMTETQSNAAMFGGAMMQAITTIDQLEKTGTVKNAVVPGLLTGLVNMAPFGSGQGVADAIGSAFNADPTGLIGPNAAQQKLAQAQLAFAIAYLRKTSGAAFGASEVANTIKEYFPLQGEGNSIITQKAAARKRAVEGMKIATNPEGKKYIDTFGGSAGGVAGATANDPLGLGLGSR